MRSTYWSPVRNTARCSCSSSAASCSVSGAANQCQPLRRCVARYWPALLTAWAAVSPARIAARSAMGALRRGVSRAGVVRLACSACYLLHGYQRLRGCAMRALVRREGEDGAGNKVCEARQSIQAVAPPTSEGHPAAMGRRPASCRYGVQRDVAMPGVCCWDIGHGSSK